MQRIKKLNKNKKAMSSIVVTVLVITLSLAAVAVVYAFVQGTIKQSLMSPAVSCIDYQTNPPISVEEICYDNQTKDLNVNLFKRLDNSKIDSIDFVVTSNGKSDRFQCTNTCQNCEILKTGGKTYYMNSESKPQKVIILINDCVLETKTAVQDC